MGCPEHAYKQMLKMILRQFNRASSLPETELVYATRLIKLNVEELETLIKEAYPDNLKYKLFMAGVGMTHWIEHANVDQWNAGAGMIEKVYELLDIIEPEEEGEEQE
jgi:hypothetical protein